VAVHKFAHGIYRTCCSQLHSGPTNQLFIRSSLYLRTYMYTVNELVDCAGLQWQKISRQEYEVIVLEALPELSLVLLIPCNVYISVMSE